MELSISAGTRFPEGATPDETGVNFTLFSRHATAVELVLYADGRTETPLARISLDPETNRTRWTWHVRVDGIGPGTHYAWRVDGPCDTALTGRRFNARKELCDPLALGVSDARHDRLLGSDPVAEGSHLPRAIVVRPLPDEPGPRWTPPELEGAVLYELHVRGFTRHPSSRVAHPGTFAGLVEKIPWLVDLGVTHVELLPVQAFDEQDVPVGTRALGLRNYWGYGTYGFFAPHPRYCADADLSRGAHEFRRMVDAFHEAGIGVILDVVLNHTSEGGDDGPWISFKGLVNEIFYHLDPADRRRYLDFTGCGNTVNCNHPIVSDLLLRSLEHWTRDLRVDGFRFDLASVLTRGEDGGPLQHPPLPWQIELSRAMQDRLLIAEAWDAAGLRHAGTFPGFRWGEWNARWRDVIRRFVRGDEVAGDAATCLAGSADLLAESGRGPARGIHYAACHDGFTLRDAVSWARKHNEGNGENNLDGSDHEVSWNCGVEGETDDPAINARRLRDSKNLLALTLLSLGTPMLLAGDEMRRTQRGNNNPWCRDDETSWIDWRLAEQNAGFVRFTREMIALRKRHPALSRDRFLGGHPIAGRDLRDIAWHGERLDVPPWLGGDPRMLACTIAAADARGADLHAVFNMSERDLLAEAPAVPGRSWHVAVDTSRDAPDDAVPVERQRPASSPFPVAARTIVVLEGRG